MQIKPIKKRLIIKLDLIWTLVFFVGFVIILYSINPFETSIFGLILFYVVLFCLLLGVLAFIRLIVKIPYWLIILLAICVIVVLLVLSVK